VHLGRRLTQFAVVACRYQRTEAKHNQLNTEAEMSSFAISMIGVVLVVAALIYGANLLGMSSKWTIIGALLIIGLGVMGGVVKTRGRDASQN
jgi:hypothetical protein